MDNDKASRYSHNKEHYLEDAARDLEGKLIQHIETQEESQSEDKNNEIFTIFRKKQSCNSKTSSKDIKRLLIPSYEKIKTRKITKIE